MSSQGLSPTLGKQCWIHYVPQFGKLPSGLQDRDAVVVLERLPDNYLSVRRLEDGAEFRIWVHQLDAGYIYNIDGRWLYEASPLVLEDLEIRLEAMRLDAPLPGPQWSHDATIDHMATILARNGRKPDWWNPKPPEDMDWGRVGG